MYFFEIKDKDLDIFSMAARLKLNKEGIFLQLLNFKRRFMK